MWLSLRPSNSLQLITFRLHLFFLIFVRLMITFSLFHDLFEIKIIEDQYTLFNPVRFIYIEDLLRFLGEEEALKVFHIVEGSAESERICKASLKSWVVWINISTWHVDHIFSFLARLFSLFLLVFEEAQI